MLNNKKSALMLSPASKPLTNDKQFVQYSDVRNKIHGFVIEVGRAQFYGFL